MWRTGGFLQRTASLCNLPQQVLGEVAYRKLQPFIGRMKPGASGERGKIDQVCDLSSENRGTQQSRCICGLLDLQRLIEDVDDFIHNPTESALTGMKDNH